MDRAPPPPAAGSGARRSPRATGAGGAARAPPASWRQRAGLSRPLWSRRSTDSIPSAGSTTKPSDRRSVDGSPSATHPSSAITKVHSPGITGNSRGSRRPASGPCSSSSARPVAADKTGLNRPTAGVSRRNSPRISASAPARPMTSVQSEAWCVSRIRWATSANRAPRARSHPWLAIASTPARNCSGRVMSRIHPARRHEFENGQSSSCARPTPACSRSRNAARAESSISLFIRKAYLPSQGSCMKCSIAATSRTNSGSARANWIPASFRRPFRPESSRSWHRATKRRPPRLALLDFKE